MSWSPFLLPTHLPHSLTSLRVTKKCLSLTYCAEPLELTFSNTNAFTSASQTFPNPRTTCLSERAPRTSSAVCYHGGFNSQSSNNQSIRNASIRFAYSICLFSRSYIRRMVSRRLGRKGFCSHVSWSNMIFLMYHLRIPCCKECFCLSLCWYLQNPFSPSWWNWGPFHPSIYWFRDENQWRISTSFLWLSPAL